MKRIAGIVFAGIIVALNAGLLLAAEGAAAAVVQAQPYSVNYFAATVLAAGIGLGIAAGFCGIGIGNAVAHGLDSIARQPELTPKIQLTMMIGLAFIESLVLYTLFIGIILLFVNPFSKFFIPQ